jgi:hypothetical protein
MRHALRPSCVTCVSCVVREVVVSVLTDEEDGASMLCALAAAENDAEPAENV